MSSPHALAVKNALIATMAVIVTIAAVRAESPADESITMRARQALHAAFGTHVSAVAVDTRNGYVTLHGKVERERIRSRAAAAVLRVQGVSGMRNLLQVVASRHRVLMQRADDVVRADIERTLRADRSLDDSRIIVRSVSNGVVLLSGEASSLSDDINALRATADRPGVRRVFSEIEGTAAPRSELVPVIASER